jgi:hypothetical protein
MFAFTVEWAPLKNLAARLAAGSVRCKTIVRLSILNVYTMYVHTMLN